MTHPISSLLAAGSAGLFLALALPCAAAPSAQAPNLGDISHQKPQVVPGAVRHAGVYHVSTGTWTRAEPVIAGFGPDVIYDNTSPSGYFTSTGFRGGFGAGGRTYDSGAIPGASNQMPFQGTPDRECYRVNGFEIGYCDLGPAGSGGWTFEFLAAYSECLTPESIPAGHEITVTGLPAGGQCWTMTIDLTGGREFSMSADGDIVDGSWDDNPETDTFGVGISYAGDFPSIAAPAGWLIAGNPVVTDPNYVPVSPGVPSSGIIDGTGTYYGAASLCNGRGSGLLNEDRMFFKDLAGAGFNSRCFFFGGYRNLNGCGPSVSVPYGALHMRLHASSDPCPVEPFEPYCNARINQADLKTQLWVEGSPVATDDEVTLVATSLPANATGFFLTSQSPGFVSQPAGSQGNLCLGGAIGRFVGPGQVKSSGLERTIRLSTTAGEWSTQSIPLPTTNYAASAGTTSYFQLWHRESFVGQPSSNFSNGVAVTWQ